MLEPSSVARHNRPAQRDRTDDADASTHTPTVPHHRAPNNPRALTPLDKARSFMDDSGSSFKEMKVSRARGRCGGGFPGSDRSREVLAGAQIDSWGPVSGPTAGIGVDFGHAAAAPSVAARSAWVSAGVRLRCGRGRPPSEAQVLGLRPAAQLWPGLRALRVAPRWRRPRPRSWSRAPWLASRRPSGHTRVRPAR